MQVRVIVISVMTSMMVAGNFVIVQVGVVLSYLSYLQSLCFSG